MPVLTLQQAAELMGVTQRTIRSLTEKGDLRPTHKGVGLNLRRYYDEDEVVALMEVRSQRLSLPRVAALAQQAFAATRKNERVLNHLQKLLGYDIPALPIDPSSILSLYLKLEDLIKEEFLDLSADEVLEWARIFYAVTEEYLHRFREVSQDEEPWRLPMEAVKKLVLNQPTSRLTTDKPLAEAYAYLEVARKNLRSVSYFYLRDRFGKRAVEKALPETTGDPHEQVILLAFPTGS